MYGSVRRGLGYLSSHLSKRRNLYGYGTKGLAAGAGYAAVKNAGYAARRLKAVAPYIYGGKSMAGYKTLQTRSRYGEKRRFRRRRFSSAKKGVTNLRKQVRTLSRQQKTSMGELIFHDRATYTARAPVNQQVHVLGYAVRTTEYEAVLAQLRFFDIANPATLVQASGAVGTYSRDYLFSTVYSQLGFMNNYQVPAKVTVYACCPKEDTSIAPTTAFTDGLVDQGNPSNTSQMVHLTDSIQFNDLWRICKRKSAIVMPGKRMSCTMSLKNIMYDPALLDSHSLVYQPKYKCFQWVVRVEGVIAHDSSVATEQGFAAAGGDFYVHTKYVVRYEAGTDLKYIYINDGADSFTNGALVSEAPVADNIAYSVS